MRRITAAAFVLVIMSITGSGCVSYQPQKVKYTLYIGLNDRSTYKQVLSNDEAENRVRKIVLKHVTGFSMIQGKGAYTDDKGVVTRENSLVVEIYDASEEQVKAIMDDILKELNQESILIEKQMVDYEFYEG